MSNTNANEQDIALIDQMPGDSSAFPSLLRRYLPIIRHKAAGFSTGSDFDDYEQEGIIALYQATKNFDRNKGGFYTYALRCIENKMIDLLHAQRKRGLVIATGFSELDNVNKDASLETPEITVMNMERAGSFNAMIKKSLSGFEYKVFALYLEDYTYNEIAEKLGKMVKSVDNAMTRVKAKLKKELADGFKM